jgi:hypothetical protein
VAYYPFTGDAKDKSGNGNDGTVYGSINGGASLTKDRFGNSNSAYSFDGTDDYILVPDASSLKFTSKFTISAWAYVIGNSTRHTILVKRFHPTNSPYNSYGLSASAVASTQYWQASSGHGNNLNVAQSTNAMQKNQWVHLLQVCDGSKIYLYVDGTLVSSTSVSGSNVYSTYGLYIGSAAQLSGQYLYGMIDDIRIYNRDLSSTEISTLYKEGSIKITKEPTSKKVAAGDTTSFSVVSTGGASYQWQIEKNGSFQNLTASCPYSFSADNVLKISPVGKDMFGNKYRVIAFNSAFSDTSDVVKLELLSDTSHVTVYDTIHVYDTTHVKVYDTTHVKVYDTTRIKVYDTITTHIKVYDTTVVMVYDTIQVKIYDTTFVKVTDTLVIKVVLALGPPAQINPLKIYPNPAMNKLFIDNGDYSKMDYYSIEIRNALGQKVFHSFIDRQLFEIDLNTWSGKGVYILKLNDKNNKTIEVRKIVLQ